MEYVAQAHIVALPMRPRLGRGAACKHACTYACMPVCLYACLPVWCAMWHVLVLSTWVGVGAWL